MQNEQDKTKNVVSRYDERIENIIKNNEAKVNELQNTIDELKENDESAALRERIDALNLQIKELEERPVDVVVQDNTEELQKQLENQKTAYEIKINNKEEQIYKLKTEIKEMQDKLQSGQSANNAPNGSVSSEYVSYLAAMERAKEALQSLTVACKDYKDGYASAKAIAQKFILDIEKIQRGNKS